MLSKFEKIEKLKSGSTSDGVPVCFCRHFPEDDLKAERLCVRHLEFLKKFDIDLVKVSLNGGYMPIAFGSNIEFFDSPDGASRVVKYRITTEDDWEKLEQPDIQEGILAEMLKGVQLFSTEVKGKVPFIITVFSPLTVAYKISGERFFKDLRSTPERIHNALKIISKTTDDFSKTALDLGANGVFFATQLASYDLLKEDEFKEFGSRYDIPILRTISRRSFFDILHIHGSNLMFDLLVRDYPVTAVNWYDRGVKPSLKDACDKFEGVLVGGLNERETLIQKDKHLIEEEVRDAISQTRKRRLMLGPGCVLLLDTPDVNLHEVIRVARES